MSDTDFFLNQTGGSVSTQLGTRLNNVKNQVLSTQSVIGIQPDNSTDAIPYTAFGKSLLNVSTLNGLVGLINSADTQVQVIDSGTGEINFTLDNALKLVVKNAYTEVLNELRGLNIMPQTDLQYDIGASGKRWNNIYGNRIYDTTAIRTAYNSTIPYMQSNHSSTESSQNVLWQHIGTNANPYQLLIESKFSPSRRLQLTAYYTQVEDIHLNPNGKVMIGGSFTTPSTTLDVNGSITTRGNMLPEAKDSRDIGTTSLPWNGVYCNGIIQPSATNAMSFNTNGLNRMFINSSGRLVLSSNVVGGAGSSNGGIALFNGSGNSEQRTTSASILSNEIRGLSGVGADAGVLRIGAGGNTDSVNHSYMDFEGYGTRNIKFVNSNTIRMIINSGGNIGINQTSPAERLDVVGNAKITGDVLFDADNQRNVGSSGQALNSVYSHNGVFKAITVHSATAGNIGTSAKPFNTLFTSNIGSSGTPVSTLYADVWATSSTSGLRCANNLVLATDLSLPTITWYDVNAKSMILVDTVNTTDGGKLSYDSANSEIVIGTTSPSVERVRIGANGIKTSVNILPTDANRNIGSSTAKFSTLYTNTILNPDANLILGRGTTSTVNISASGMSIGSGSNPTEALNVTGNIKVSGNILPNVHNVPKIGTSNTDRFLEGWFGTVYGNGVALTSDRRLKDNIKPITNALETVMKMKPVEYKMKGRVRTHTGFIADEVKNLYNGEDWAVFVEAQDEFKTQSLQYTEIVAVLASALQEVNYRLSKVEGRKLVGNSVIDTSGLTEDFVSIYQRLEALESQLELVNKPVKPQLHRCVEVSRINEMMDRISNLECNESKSNSSEDFELMHSLMEKNHQQELRINDLENKLNQIQSQPKVESKSVDFLAESDGGLNMIDMLQTKNYEMEQRILKLEKQNKKLIQAVNRLLKTTDE